MAGGANELRKGAMKVLSKTTPASTCEHNWSAFAAVQTSTRNRLSSNTLHDLVYARGNLRSQQKHTDPGDSGRVAREYCCRP